MEGLKEIVELTNQLSGFKGEISRMEKILKSQRKSAKQLQGRIISWMDQNELTELQVSPMLSVCIRVRDKKVGLTAAEKKEKLEEWILAKGMSSWDEYNQYLMYCTQQQKVEKVRVLEFKSLGEPPMKRLKTIVDEPVPLVEQVD